MPQAATRMPWLMIVCATVIMMITAGGRQTMGLFVAPLDSATGLGIIAISLAMAVGQLMWGVGQLLFGALADRYGPGRVIVLGGLMMALGTALTPFVRSEWALIITLGLLSAFGSGAGSFAILIGTSSQRIPLERRPFGIGIITSGSSAGQFILAPVTQLIISSFGWVSAMLTLAATALLTLPLAWPLRRSPTHAAASFWLGVRLPGGRHLTTLAM